MLKEFTGKTDNYGNKLYLGDKVIIEGHSNEELKICKNDKNDNYTEKYWMMGWAYLGIDGFKKEYKEYKIKKVIKPQVEIINYIQQPYTAQWIVNSNKDNISKSMTTEVTKFPFKIIHNGNTTIAILEDGSKGIAKCLESDTYDKQKDMEIACYKALVKSYQKQIKKLSK